MADEVQYWEGYRLNPNGTIQFSAIVDYGILAVPTGLIFQFNHAASQAEMDEAAARGPAGRLTRHRLSAWFTKG